MEGVSQKKVECSIFDQSGQNLLKVSFFGSGFESSFTTSFQYIIFGSPSSKDYDVLVYVPKGVTRRTVPTEQFNMLCNQLDSLLSPFLCKDVVKPINSCLGCWEDGRMIWCQKGWEEEVNNCILDTFHHHRQMFTQCPLMQEKRMLIDAKRKAITTVREILCKLSGVTLTSPDNAVKVELLCKLLVDVFRIPEIRFGDNLHNFCHAVLPSFVVGKNLWNSLMSVGGLDFSERERELLRNTSLCNSDIKKLVEKVKLGEDVNDILRIIVSRNLEAASVIERFFSAKDPRELEVQESVKYDQVVELLKSKKQDVKQVISNVRSIQKVGVRGDLLMMIDFTILTFSFDGKKVEAEEKADRYKEIAFKLGQTVGFFEGKELFSKEAIALEHPKLKRCLMRETLDVKDFLALNEYCQRMLKHLYNEETFDRDEREILD